MITKIRASNGIWYAKWIIPYSNGKYARRSLETRDEEAAELKLKQFKLENGQLIHNSNIKLSDLYSKYFSLYTEYGKKAKYELYPLRFFIEYMKKDVFCDSITGYDIERYKIWRSKQKRQVWNKGKKKFQNSNKTVSPASINIELRMLRALFNKAIRQGLIKNNPFIGIEPLPVVKVKKKIISDSEMLAIITSASVRQRYSIGHNQYEQFEYTTVKNIFWYAYLTGSRLSEILNLQWNDIDFERQIIHISNKINRETETVDFETKSGEERDIPLNESVYKVLMEQKEINDNAKYIFSKGGDHKYSKSHISKFFKKVIRENGLSESYSFHGLRHCAITNMIKRNANINSVKEIAGHANIKTTMKYIHTNTEDLRESMNLLTFPKAQ